MVTFRHILLVILFFIGSKVSGQDNDLLLHLNFDDAKEIPQFKADEDLETENTACTKELISGAELDIHGLAKYVKGVKGSAIKFDGFSSYIEGGGEVYENYVNEWDEIELPEQISIEAWVSLGAYPWNWAPIITLGKYKITGFYFGIDSRGRLGFHMSDATSVWHECNSKINEDTKLGLELHKWYHVMGTYSPENGLKIYINGLLAGSYNNFEFDYGIVYSDLDKGFRLGKNTVDLAPTDAIRDWATYPSRYTLDGIVDEIKIHKKEWNDKEILETFNATVPENEPEFASRKFPGVESSGRFGANYTRLNFYPEWDALWPVGEAMDVVVQFDEHPTKIMFWRGTRYSPCLVSENGKWMADQSRETGKNWFLSEGDRDEMPTGCIEHMSDVQCRSSRVAIIENNDARVVVNWRYLQMDVKFRQRDLENETGFGEWGNEMYYIYPDGTCIRHVLPGIGGWQETILLNEPGTKPEDNIELEACKLYNMKGESKSYSWENGYPEFDLDNANIQLINFKSDYKPFIIFREGGGFEVFNLEVRPEYSHFPWWNHWPVAQIISDGRSANAPDRAAHSSLSWGDPNGEAALYGMTNNADDLLVDLAKSWNNPPEIQLKGNGFNNMGYDYRQRAYQLQSITNNSNLEFTIKANEDTPLMNMALVIDNWNGKYVKLFIDGIEVPEGKDFRYGFEYDVKGKMKVIIWIKKRTKENIEILIKN